MKNFTFDRALRIGLTIGLAIIAIYLFLHVKEHGFAYVLNINN